MASQRPVQSRVGELSITSLRENNLHKFVAFFCVELLYLLLYLLIHSFIADQFTDRYFYTSRYNKICAIYFVTQIVPGLATGSLLGLAVSL
jgi:hypothetical protein